MKIAMGFMAAKHLFAASDIGLFEALAAGPASIDELANKTGVPSRTLGIVADAMVAIGLIERQGSRYRNQDTAAAFLAGNAGPDLRPMLRFWDQISYPLWQKVGEAVRTGHGQAQFGKFNPTEQQIFSEGVEFDLSPDRGGAYDILRLQPPSTGSGHRRGHRLIPHRRAAALSFSQRHLV